MAIIFRIDVDSPFGWQNLYRKAISRFHLDYYGFSLRYYKLGYFDHVLPVIEELAEHKIPSFWFFELPTRPSKKLTKQLEDNGSEVAIHIVQDKDYLTFQKEIQKFESKVNVKIRGFSKHGSGSYKGSRYHDYIYDPQKLIEFSRKSKLDYFLGNREQPNDLMETHDSVKYFPSAFWLSKRYRDVSKYDFDWLVNESKNRDIQILFHPMELILDSDVKELYKKIINLPNSSFKHEI